MKVNVVEGVNVGGIAGVLDGVLVGVEVGTGVWDGVTVGVTMPGRYKEMSVPVLSRSGSWLLPAVYVYP